VYRNTLLGQNIFTVHARDDSVVPVSNTRNMVNAIFTGGGFPAETFPPLGSPGDHYVAHGNLQYYETAFGDHPVWEFVYREPAFYDWMFAQSLPEPTGAMTLLPLAAAAACGRRRRNVSFHRAKTPATY
jgi:hypothetical protein